MSSEATPIPSPHKFSRISAVVASGFFTHSLMPLLSQMLQCNNEDEQEEEEEDKIMEANEETKSSVMLMIVLKKDLSGSHVHST